MGPRAIAIVWGLALAQPAAAQDLLWMETWLHAPLMDVVNDPDTALTAFTTDGCSGGMSDVWIAMADVAPAFASQSGQRPPWEPCCVIHDYAYHTAGGASTPDDSAAARLAADQALQACVAGWAKLDTSPVIDTYGLTPAQLKQSYAALSLAMFQAVRLGGAPCSGLPWRWGYGYPHCTPLGNLKNLVPPP